MKSPLASALRERLIEAILPEVPFDGWSRHALRRAAERCGIEADEAFALFPEGATSLVAEFSHWLDRRMEERLLAAPPEPLSEPEPAAAAGRRGGRRHPARVSIAERVRRAVLARLDLASPWREAVRRAAAILALPQNAPLALTLLGETADRIWYAVGDEATDFSFYTKRLTLAAILAATLLYWLDDRSPDFADTEGFLDRRLGNVAEFGKARQRFFALVAGAPNPLLFFRPSG